MKRRTVLISLGTLFPISSGCLGRASSGNTSFPKRVSVTQIDAVPERYPVDLTIEVTQATITNAQTAHLRTTATNTGDTTRKFDVPYYKGASSSAGESGILLYALKAPDSPPADYAPECIGTDGKSKHELIWTNEFPTPASLEPGQSSIEELIVVDDPTKYGCLPTGEYRFEAAYNIHDEDGYDETFTWGFTLEVSEDEP